MDNQATLCSGTVLWVNIHKNMPNMPHMSDIESFKLFFMQDNSDNCHSHSKWDTNFPACQWTICQNIVAADGRRDWLPTAGGERQRPAPGGSRNGHGQPLQRLPARLCDGGHGRPSPAPAVRSRWRRRTAAGGRRRRRGQQLQRPARTVGGHLRGIELGGAVGRRRRPRPWLCSCSRG